MKRAVLLVSTVLLAAVASAQSEWKKRPSIGLQFTLVDFQSATDVRNNTLVTAISKKQLFRFSKAEPSITVNYLQGLTERIDFSGLVTGSFLKHPTSDAVRNPDNENYFFLEGAATANFKLLSDRYAIVPFATAGIGATMWKHYFSGTLPLGVGVQARVADGVFILLQSQYRIPVSENGAYHFWNSLGFTASLKGAPKPVVLPPAPPVVLDRDGDGVLDLDDRCPDVAGLAALKGCPDRDGDGIADIDDKCPDKAGIAKYQGCPIPDTDGDGINDENDKCPTVRGVAKYQGCPVPDTDGDGVNDDEDRCPTRPGPASNQGCPVIAKEVIEKINFAAKNVFFSTGSYKLLPKSFKGLDEVVALLKTDESLMIDIDGHTDAQGSDESNQVLSDNRAGAVKTYLVSKGISESRLKSAGYGETKPVADNATAAGRAKNRRTEMTVRNF